MLSGEELSSYKSVSAAKWLVLCTRNQVRLGPASETRYVMYLTTEASLLGPTAVVNVMTLFAEE
jgi:hypothetical protein